MEEKKPGRKGHTDIREFLGAFKDKLRRIENFLGWEFGHQTECCGVSLTQRLVILELGKKDQTSLVELSQSLGLDASTLSRSINGLVNIGFVQRDINPSDRRCISLTLTEHGRGVRERIETISDEYFQKVFRCIPEDRHQNILESISILTDALQIIGREKGDGELPNDPAER